MWIVLVEGIQLRIDQIHFLSTRCTFICPMEASPLPMDVLGKLVYSLERQGRIIVSELQGNWS